MKYSHKSQFFTSDNYQVTFILAEQSFEILFVSCHTGAQPSTPQGRFPRWWNGSKLISTLMNSQAESDAMQPPIVIMNVLR